MKKESLKSLLKNKDYLLLLGGFFVSRTGTFMQNVALAWQLYQLTKSPVSLGLLGLANFIPIFIMSFFSGIASDFFNRKKIIFIVQIVSIINACVLAFLTISGQITPWLIYICVAIDASFYSFESPARQAMTPTLMSRKEYSFAVNINNIAYHSTNFLGPALSGFIIAYSGVKSVYVINAVTFFFVMITLFFMGPAKRNLENHPELNFKSIKEGIDFVFRSPLIYGSMFIDFFATFFASASTLMPIFAVDILKVGPKEMGFLYAAPSIGAIIAGVIFTFMTVRDKGKALISSVVAFGVATFLFAFSRNYFLSLFLIGITGAADMISAIIRNFIRQINTPDHIRGRMTAINMAFYSGGPQLGEVEAGFAAHYLGTPLSVALGGIATVIATLIIAKKVPQLSQYKDVD